MLSTNTDVLNHVLHYMHLEMKTVSCFDDFREKYFETLLIYLGTGQATIADEISEKFQTAFDPPPPIFGKLCCKFFIMDMVEYIQGGTRAR